MALATVFEQLDQWVTTENQSATIEGFPLLPQSVFRVVGQAALLEAHVQFNVAATVDVDVLNNARHEVVAKLSELLNAEGLELDPLGNEIWMPSETLYVDIFRGDWITAMRAETEHIMVSKALKAPTKNRVLLRSYIATRPPESFFKMCEKYRVDLNGIIEST